MQQTALLPARRIAPDSTQTAAHLWRPCALHVGVDPVYVVLELLLRDAVQHREQAAQVGGVGAGQLLPAALNGLAQRGHGCSTLLRILQQLLNCLDGACRGPRPAAALSGHTQQAQPTATRRQAPSGMQTL